MRTVRDLIAIARGHIQDSTVIAGEFRYTDEDLLAYVNNAVLEIRMLRPDFFVSRYDDMPIYSIDDAYTLDVQTEVPIVYYVAGSAMLRDDEFAVDGRAVGMLNLFRSKLVGRPS